MFSSVIKSARTSDTSIQSYAMREVERDTILTRGEAHLTGNTLDARKKMEQLLEEIGEREKYIKQMTDRSHTLEKEAYEKGFAQGERAGMELGKKRFDSVVASFKAAAESLEKSHEMLYRRSEQQVVELILAIARAVIKREVGTDRYILLSVIRSALRHAADRERIRVKLHPSDAEFALQQRVELLNGLVEAGKLSIEADATVPRGNALIESDQGIIECGIEKHVREVEKAFRAYALPEKTAPVDGAANGTET